MGKKASKDSDLFIHYIKTCYVNGSSDHKFDKSSYEPSTLLKVIFGQKGKLIYYSNMFELKFNICNDQWLSGMY